MQSFKALRDLHSVIQESSFKSKPEPTNKNQSISKHFIKKNAKMQSFKVARNFYIQLSKNHHPNQSPEPTKRRSNVSKTFLRNRAKFQSSSKLLHPVIQELSSKSKSRTYKKKIEILVKCFLKQMQSFKVVRNSYI